MNRLLITTLVTVLIASGPAHIHADAPVDAAKQAELASQAYGILKNRCYRCHGGEKKIEGIDVLDRNLLTANLAGRDEDPRSLIVPGKPDDSELWYPIEDERMPKEGSKEARSMTAEERATLKEWIEAGAPFPERTIREFVTTRTILQAMRDHLFKAKADDRAYQRFFTLTHLYNNARVTEDDLRLYAAGLSKLINSLSYERQIVLPKLIEGTSGTVFVVDLRDLGWDKRNLWGQLLKHYPYGLTYDFINDDEDLQQISKDLTLLSGTFLAHVRSDWFVFTASRPPLYEIMMDIPGTIQELEHRLGVDFESNFEHNRLVRGGFNKSGVSSQNRLVERHEYSTGSGSYWISYDFKPRRAKADLVRFPLGPKFPGNKFNQFAFEHDGGEAIFSLPNGLQAYMLALGDGTRLDEPAPADVVYDDSAVAGTPAVVNGLSCMNCHKNGMIDFRDEIRNANAVGGATLNKVRDLYPPQAEMNVLVDHDRKRFLVALERTIGPFLKVGDDAKKPIEQFPEPISKVAKRYLADLGPAEAAAELDIVSAKEFQARVRGNRELLKFGLGTLILEPAGTIKREKWEAIDGSSLFQDVAGRMSIGTPISP